MKKEKKPKKEKKEKKPKKEKLSRKERKALKPKKEKLSRKEKKALKPKKEKLSRKERKALKPKKERYYLLDSLRGITLISMLVYHFCVDLQVFGLIDWLYTPPAVVWQKSICITFIFLSGFCFQMGKHKIKRGIIILSCGVVLSLFTYIFMRNIFISFGILSFIGIAVLITVPLNLIFKRLKSNHWVEFFVFIALFVLVFNIWNGKVLFGLVNVPTILYRNVITAYLGFPPVDFFSSDYFPIFPWMFLYIAGYFAYNIFKRYNLLRFFLKPRIKPLEFIGRHTLWFYIAHQPILYGIAFLINLACNQNK